ncbi:MAG: UDP-N-acetylglucosamine 2-epimerase (hydrolyzing), partial [Nitrospirae bacterium]
MRKIAVITGTRAEYGLLYWIIKGIHEDPKLKLQLIVTGMHLSPEFGLTVREIEKDGFPIAEKIEMLLSSDTEASIATSMGVGMIGFAKAYERLRPDILLALGDRFEILAAVSAAVPFRIPVAHIHGGEVTEGAMDELFRHAITKMSHIHFPAVKIYADRIIQMGEQPENVFCFGAPGLDNLYEMKLLNRIQLAKSLGLPA